MAHPTNIKIEEYDYPLESERIAKHPLANRDSSKLLVYRDGEISDLQFKDAVSQIPDNSLLVFNNTRVVSARLIFSRGEGRKPIEVFCLEPTDLDIQQAMGTKRKVRFTALVGGAKKWKTGPLEMPLQFNDAPFNLIVEKVSRDQANFILEFSWEADLTFAEVLDIAGKTPIPPYLQRQSEESDKDRYQTVYAKYDGSVAAPTAGLHFTPEILNQLKSKGIKTAEVTLHVGAGTFKPVSAETIGDHDMHYEEIHVNRATLETLAAHEGPIISVGTTSTRTLETLYWLGLKEDNLDQLDQWAPYAKNVNASRKEALQNLLEKTKGKKEIKTRTQLMIAPGYKYRVISGLFTNFHQPKSTLLLLVSAAIGRDWKKVYDHALNNAFRFLSYGDSSLLFIPKENRLHED